MAIEFEEVANGTPYEGEDEREFWLNAQLRTRSWRDDGYEPDEPTEDVAEARERGQKRLTELRAAASAAQRS